MAKRHFICKAGENIYVSWYITLQDNL